MLKKIVILVSENCLFSGVAGPMDMFLQAGVVWNSLQGIAPSPYFDVKIVTLDGKAVTAYNDIPIVPHCSIDEIDHTDVILIPSQGFNFEQNEVFYKRVKWIRQWYDKGADLASMCTGAFTLAATGLLDGKQATTHWAAAQTFRTTFPLVDLRIDLMVTDEGRLFCSGGITADLNLSLYLINKYCGREVALECSRCTLVDLDRLSQLPFTVFIPEKNHNDHEIVKIQDWIENEFNQNITLEGLAEKTGMSTRNFNRRFKIATGETAIKYLQLIRVEAAKKELENTRLSFDEIANFVGYENVSFFRRIFKRFTGLSASAYRKKFR